ncbi:hypothetical protein [Microvirga tunisiensis]|uniref:Uncharacterized protein n=1 Tax=Microvirga tunisiensis TaxID=2108360 RepID=A0A5N7MBS3_9HYPH|nr:hypothetical protein [Microvirga tunisiensis]MPR05488.1 hypothetical protein [Microvirga tunisiensis]MPR23689.1 hypothetical protein [Microvirga tunisiensis]
MKTSLMAGLVAGISLSTFTQAFGQEVRDGFYWLDRLNRASLVMLSEQKILSGEQTNNIAKALDQLYEEGKNPGSSAQQAIPRLSRFSSELVVQKYRGFILAEALGMLAPSIGVCCSVSPWRTYIAR